MNEDLVRTQYVIKKILETKKATNHMKSLTVNEIAKMKEKTSQILCTSIYGFLKKESL